MLLENVAKTQYCILWCNLGIFPAGVSHSELKNMEVSHVVEKVSFTDTPKVYEEGSVVEGKVS